MHDTVNLTLDWPPVYDDLFMACESQSFDLSADWFRLLVKTALPKNVEPRIQTCELSGERVILPLAIHRKFAGYARITSLTTFYTTFYRPLWLGEVGLQAVCTCLSNVTNATQVSSFRFDAMDPASHAYTLLDSALTQIGYRTFRFFEFGNWYLPVAGLSYEAYFHGLSSRVRNTVNRRERSFLADGRGHLEIVTGGESIETAIQAWVRIYNASWKNPEPFPEFMPELIRLCAARQWLRLGLAFYDDEPIAAQVWIVSHGRAAIYKLAYDEKFVSLSAGTLLTAKLMRHVMDVDKVDEVDYLIGDEAYKKDWMTHRRERWGIVAYNPCSCAGFLGFANERLRQLTKQIFAWGRAAYARAKKNHENLKIGEAKE